MKSIFESPAILTLLPLLFQSTLALPSLAPRNSACNVTFNRFSKQDTGSFLGTVEHTINLFSFEEGKNGVPIDMSSCWTVVGWKSGCTWGREETTNIDEGWGIEHEAYTTFDDHAKDVKIHGNDCEGTTLKCTASHSHYTLPNPGDPNGGGQYFYISDTKCALAGENVDALLGGDDRSVQLAELLAAEGNEDGYNGKFSTLKDLGPAPVPAPYTCMHFPVSESVCTAFWECEDKAASITAYFDGGVSMASTMTTQPTAAPIASPGPCNGS